MSQMPAEFLKQQARDMSAPMSPSVGRLCSRCKEMEVWTETFKIEDRLLDLEQLSSVCDFCLLRWDTCYDLGIHTLQEVVFERSGSHIMVNKRYPPVLSIFQEPGMWISTRSMINQRSVDRDAHKCLKCQTLMV